jgi:hypothetical protein
MHINNAPQLHGSHARLVQLIAHLKGAILLEDETRHIVMLNQAFCDMFAIPATPAMLIGTDCSGSADASKHLFVDPAAFVARIDAILQRREAVNDEILYLRDGRVFSRDYVPVYDADRYIGHLWQYHDVSARFQAQQRWQRLLSIAEVNREVTRLFLQHEQLDDAVNAVLAMTGHLLDVSRVYVFRFREHERILDNTHEWCAPGVTPEIENLQGLPFDDILPSFFPLIAQHDLIAPYHIRELPADLRGILEPQDIQTVLWVPLYLDHRIEGFVGYDETRHAREWLPEEITMVRIITESYARALEREQARRMLIQARDEAVRTAQLRAQFVANMSHEIRTPLTGTLGMLELLLETDLDELQREFAAESHQSASHLLAIINNILDFAKLEAGQMVLAADPIDLSAIATEIKMTLLPQIRARPLEFHLNIDPDVPYRVYGDATRLRQVLMNLAGNAVKFTTQGRVALSIQVGPVVENVMALQFAVEDTGVGIAEEHIARIFESFVQADGSITRKYGGSGLGLSISKQLIELMGGTLEVSSTPGIGSSFGFRLALPVAQETGIDMTARAMFKGIEVLLVDSNRTACYVLAQQLENWGCYVSQLHDPAALPELIRRRERPFDLLFQRYTGAAMPDFAQLSRLAHKMVSILDDQSPPPDTAADTVTWPIDQATLYHLLEQAQQAEPLEPLEAVPSTASPASGRVLLVDDYPVNADLVRYALADLPLQIDLAENGQQALDQLAIAEYDLVLMDMHMPVMDGMEATRHIRESNAPYRSIPILAFTANVMREQQARYLAIGVDAIISKPFAVSHLRDMVQHWLRPGSGDQAG